MAVDVIAVIVTLVVVLICAWFLSAYMVKVFGARRTVLSPLVRPVERLFYRLAGIKEDEEQSWWRYGIALFAAQVVTVLFSYLIFRFQGVLPWNPEHLPGVPADLALNTAISFVTNTNWQSYAGESTMSYLSQMMGLATQNFLSAATGISLAVALVRALSNRTVKTIGNFWVDWTRTVLYILLPISIGGALFLVSQGVVQTLGSYPVAHTLQGATQVIAQGPVASQEIIKELGTNGGGFFNANSGHPYENPNGLTNQFELFCEILIPFALAFMFGRWVLKAKQGMALAGAMLIILVAAIWIAAAAEQAGNPALTSVGAGQANSSTMAGGNMEGKEVRFGPILSAEFLAITTNTSTGAVNAAHDSMTPIGGLVALVDMQLGEVSPGGVGSGLYGILVFAVIAVFIAGLMVGRTPEYLGKKIESKEMRMATLAILVGVVNILVLTAIAVVLPAGRAGPLNPGPHGFSEILYAFTSANANNGSAFAGISADTHFYNFMLSVGLWVGRFAMIVPVLALAGALAGKKVVPAGRGTLATDGVLFAWLVVGVIIIVGALTFFPALSLGPVLEQLQLFGGHLSS